MLGTSFCHSIGTLAVVTTLKCCNVRVGTNVQAGTHYDSMRGV